MDAGQIKERVSQTDVGAFEKNVDLVVIGGKGLCQEGFDIFPIHEF
jgi:hypothetical protein